MFKSIITRSALVLPVVALGVFGITTAASASDGPVQGSMSVTAKATGQAAFKYTDPILGPVKVNETHHGDCQAGNFDTLGATLAVPDLASAGETITVPWASDFVFSGGGGVGGCDVNVGFAVLTFSHDGLSYSGNAYYPNG
jgi:hypothetical protein